MTGSPPPGDRPADPAIRLLADRAQIGDVIMRYAAAVDRRDWELLESCFSPDVKVVGWRDRDFADRGELLDYIQGVSHFHTTMHMMGNQFIEVDGDRASLESYAMLTHHGHGGEGGPIELNRSGGLYIERLERRPDGWVIGQRGGEPVWAPTGVTAVGSDDPTVRRLLARAEIHDLMMSYALGVDRRDYRRVSSCFASTFDVSYGSRRFTDLPSLLAFIGGVERFESTTHFLGQPVVEVEGDRAFALTYAMITHRSRTGGDADVWTIGGPNYRDALERQEGRWRIARRGEAVDWTPGRRPFAPPTTDPVARWLLDRAEIAQLIATVAGATDAEDGDLLGDCLAPGFEQCAADGAVADRDALLGAFERAGRPSPRRCHFLGNQLVDLGGDEARVETYAYVTGRDVETGRLTPWSHGPRRFVDEVVRRDDQWYLARRDIETNRVKD